LTDMMTTLVDTVAIRG